MSELALQLIAENKAKRERGEDATYLDLGRCGLTRLPAAIKELVWLETLILSDMWIEYDWNKQEWKFKTSPNKGEKNSISSIDGIENLLLLRKFIIEDEYEFESKSYSTKVNDLFPLMNLINLEELYFSRTHVTDLESLKNLINLKSVSFASTKIKTLYHLRNLSRLQILNCSYTNIRTLKPLEILTNLKTLDCGSTLISTLKPLENLYNLEHLRCDSTSVIDLTPLRNLINLKQLYCNGTKINDLSPVIKMEDLKSLWINSTLVKSILELSNLKNLERFSCNETEVEELESLSDLIALKELRCIGTKITNLSPLSKLVNLKVILCGSTPVTDISPLHSLIKKKINVKCLSFRELIEENRDGGISPVIQVKDCPLTNPPVEIAQQGNEAILAYWEQIEKQGAGTLNEAKLIIVGEGKTGKTTLFNKLIDPEFDLQKNPTDETHGINIHEGLAMHEDFRANLWDFGGQELQYMTHQFFLSPKALYVLMMEARAEAPNLAYWFKIISLLGKDSPDEKVSLLLVLNKKKGGTGMPQYQDLLKLYEQDFDYQFLEVDFAKNDKRWECLHEAITHRLSALPIVNNLLPKQWKPIREALRDESKSHAYISTTRLNEICSEFGVTSEIDQWQMTDYLHRLGSLLHFQNDEDLMDLVILRPEWAVEGVYTTLKSDLIKEDQKGKFTAQDIFNILSEKGYSRTDAQKILKLMSKNNFDICYESEQTGQYVAAQLLPDNRPQQFKWHTHTGALQFRFQYPVMPKGLMSRLIVRLSGYLEKVDGVEIVWKKGAVLNITKDGSTCRLMMQEDDGESKTGLKQIIIEVMEDEIPFRNRKYALEQVRREIKSIHEKWFKNIKFEEIVPCNCEECKKSTEPFTHPLSELLKLTKGRAFCNRMQDTVPLTQLLEGVYQTEEISALTRSAFMDRHEMGMDRMGFNPVFNIRVDNQPQINISNVNQSDLSALETMLKQMSGETRQALETFVETLPEPETPEEKTGLGKSILKWLNKNAEGIAVNVSASVYYDALKMLMGI